MNDIPRKESGDRKGAIQAHPPGSSTDHTQSIRLSIAIEIPDDIWNDDETGVIRDKRLPKHWDAIPHHQATMLYGDRWLKAGKQLGMIVPSAVLEEESNIVLNPHHSFKSRLKIRKSRPFVFDLRLASSIQTP